MNCVIENVFNQNRYALPKTVGGGCLKISRTMFVLARDCAFQQQIICYFPQPMPCFLWQNQTRSVLVDVSHKLRNLVSEQPPNKCVCEKWRMKLFALPPWSFSEFKRPKITYHFVHHGEDHIVENPKGPSVHDISESLLIDAETVDIPESVVQTPNRSFSSARVRLRGCRICQHSKPVRMTRNVHIYTRMLYLN